MHRLMMVSDDFFEAHSQEYSTYTLETKQYFISFENHDYPIYLVQKIHRPQASLVGNLCISDSSIIYLQKIDPLLVFARYLKFGEKRALEYEDLFRTSDNDQLNHLLSYVQKHTSFSSRVALICKTQSVDDVTYYLPDVEKLYQFIDKKIAKLNSFVKDTPDFEGFCCNINATKAEQAQSILLVCNYLSQELFNSYKTSRNMSQLFNFDNKPIKKDVFLDKDSPQVKKEEKQKEPKVSAKEEQLSKDAKKCQSLTQIWSRKKE